MKKFVLVLCLGFVSAMAQAQDVQALPPVKAPVDASVKIAPVPSPAGQSETVVAVPPAPAEDVVVAAPAVAAAAMSIEGVFNLFYTEMITRYGYPSRVGYTSAAAHLAMCTPVIAGQELNDVQAQLDSMQAIRWHMDRTTSRVIGPGGRVAVVSTFANTLHQTRVRIAAILACKRGNRSAAQMVQAVIAYGLPLQIGRGTLDMQLGFNWEAAALMMP